MLEKIGDAWSHPKHLEFNDGQLKVNGFNLRAFVDGCMKIYKDNKRVTNLRNVGQYLGYASREIVGEIDEEDKTKIV